VRKGGPLRRLPFFYARRAYNSRMSASRPTHLNARGEARMVDVGGKPARARLAIAEGWIRMNAQTLAALQSGAQKKGDAFAVARIAGIMAAKRTAEWVPLCHPLMLTRVEVELRADGEAVHCTATTATRERTGVEMEALCAVQAALLTLYDMGKSLQRAMVIDNVRLVHKSGGRSGEWNRGEGVDEKAPGNLLPTRTFQSSGDWINRLLTEHCTVVTGARKAVAEVKDKDGKVTVRGIRARKGTRAVDPDAIKFLCAENNLELRTYPNPGMLRMNAGVKLRAAAKRRHGLIINGVWMPAPKDFPVRGDKPTENQYGKPIVE